MNELKTVRPELKERTWHIRNPVEYHIKSTTYVGIEDIVSPILEDHPNAKISVEVVVG